MTTAAPVLVVEDDHPIRDALIEILTDTGFSAVGAANGSEAIELLRTLDPRPCLVLLDLMMPVMDGASFRREQVKDPSLAHIPVIVLSAYADAAAQAKRMGVDGFLRKPLEARQVIALAHAHCATA